MIDAAGAPVPDVEVSAHRLSLGGIPTWHPVSEVRTDAGGDFRIAGLVADTYLVSARLPLSTAGPFGSAPAYFAPGTLSAARAEVVSVDAGRETRGVTVRMLPPESTVTLTGHVQDAAGQPRAGVRLVLYETLDVGRTKRHVAAGTSLGDGRFRIEGLVDGAYRLETLPMSAAGGGLAAIDVQVSGEDITGLVVIVAAGR